MNPNERVLNPSEAANRLGVSTKALRLYEQRGLIAPVRTAAGWRTYGPAEMARAAEIVALRSLGLSLAEVAGVLGGNRQSLEPALAAHQAKLEGQALRLSETIGKVRAVRNDLTRGQAPTASDLAQLAGNAEPGVSFDLPWPWGRERFNLPNIQPLTYITGPLGSGKTQLSRMIADTLPDAIFLGLDRLDRGGSDALEKLHTEQELWKRVKQSLARLVEDGATESLALTTLLIALHSEGPSALIVDLIEQGLDQASQEALVDFLRHRAPGARSLFLLTRSSAILDMDSIGPQEAILLCPANHSPPIQVSAIPGSPGYEAVATCLASPEVRARTEGVIALRPQRA